MWWECSGVISLEGEDIESSEDEDGSEEEEDVVTGVSPSSIDEYLSGLSERERERLLLIENNCNVIFLPPDDSTKSLHISTSPISVVLCPLPGLSNQMGFPCG